MQVPVCGSVQCTRVMTSDLHRSSSTIGQDVGELVTRLAWELIRGVRGWRRNFQRARQIQAPGEAATSGESYCER